MGKTEIKTQASDASASSRAFPFPVLEAGNDSFPNGIYTVTCEDKEAGKSFSLRHQVQGAPLIGQWIQQGKVDFACTVAAPRSMYRALHKSTAQDQVVDWQPEDLGEYPMFTPMIVANQDIQHTAASAPDGLNQVWDGRELQLPKGSRIALGHTFRFKAGISGLMDFNLDGSLAPGRFRIMASNEDGFKFKVFLATDLYGHLRHRREELAGKNIMVHIVSAALSTLQRDYSQEDEEDDWKSYRNLIGLAELLAQNNLPHWSDDNFHPELAATSLHPHSLPTEVQQQ